MVRNASSCTVSKVVSDVAIRNFRIHQHNIGKKSICARSGQIVLDNVFELSFGFVLLGHHTQTNIDGKDPDLQHFQHLEPDKAPGYRLTQQQPWVPKYTNFLVAIFFQVCGVLAVSPLT
jgi:hypothetical protein